MKTVALDLPICFFFGSLIALSGHRRICYHGWSEVRRLGRLATGYAAWWSLAVGVVFAWQPDWMLSYMIDAATLPLTLTYVAFALSLLLAAWCGAVATGDFLLRGRWGGALGLAGLGLFFEGLIFALTFDRYEVVGTYAQFHAGRAPAMSDLRGFQLLFNAVGLATIVPLVLIVILTWRSGWGEGTWTSLGGP